MKSPIGCPRSDRGGREGFILVSVLLVSMFLVSAAVGYSWFVRDQVRRLDRQRLELECRGIALLAAKNVIKGLVSDENGYDSPHEKWFGNHVIPLGDRYIASVTITPLNDKLPLWNVFLPDGSTIRGEMAAPWKEAWERMDLANLEMAALDFMDRDKTPRVGGAEKEFYINRAPSDPSAFLLFPEISVASLVGTEEIPGLRDLFTVWCGAKLNVNTVKEQVLSILDGIDEVTAKEIIVRRAEKPYKHISELAKLPAFSGTLGPKLINILGTVSDYFLVDLQVSVFGSELSKSYRITVDKKNVLSWEER